MVPILPVLYAQSAGLCTQTDAVFLHSFAEQDPQISQLLRRGFGYAQKGEWACCALLMKEVSALLGKCSAICYQAPYIMSHTGSTV